MFEKLINKTEIAWLENNVLFREASTTHASKSKNNIS